jgi:2OG-Fe(II) oxygenase superfamily
MLFFFSVVLLAYCTRLAEETGMPITPRERLARVLDGSKAPSAFCTQLSVPARGVQLTLADAGPISLPIKAPQAKRMIESARPAQFGRGEQTLMDLSVRDTWELTPDQVTLTGLDWDTILTEVRDKLGLPEKAELRAEPHALLVYGKGQFFQPHQDSEKDDAMIGTLVVSLPSSHTGGELVVEHKGKKATYRAPATEVSVAAFYADCRHEVKPVTTGYRVTFTYNLLLDSDPANDVPVEPSAEAARYLTEHFTSTVSRWQGDDRKPPNRLVYLLDHEYTQRGLSWDRLKAADAGRAALLRAAAEDAGCEAVLSLTELQETWDTEPRGRGVVLTYIIVSDLTLTWWTAVPGGESITLHVPEDQVCASTPSVAQKPYDSQYTGYMGNYGNTMDRWYRRAAVVVWPRQYAFAARAEVSPSWALTELRTRLSAGDPAGALAAAKSLEPFWTAPGPDLLVPGLHAVTGLADPDIAFMLLRPFPVEWVTSAHARGLAALSALYDEAWQQNLIEAWFDSRNPMRYQVATNRLAWLAVLPRLVGDLRHADAETIADRLVAMSWNWLDGTIRDLLESPSPTRRRRQLAELGKPLAGLLAAAEGTALAGDIASVLREHDDDVLACLLPTLRAAGSRPGATVEELARDCERRLSAITARPARAEDDWSVPWSGGCGCELCGTVGEFLADRDKRKLEWPLAEARRNHVVEQLRAAELPVDHEVWKFGSPHTLVLGKTGDMFGREAGARKEAEADLDWLAARRDGLRPA